MQHNPDQDIGALIGAEVGVQHGLNQDIETVIGAEVEVQRILDQNRVVAEVHNVLDGDQALDTFVGTKPHEDEA